MNRKAVLILPVVFYLLFFGCSSKITPEEAKVLVALDEIQRGVEADIDYDRFDQLLKTAKAELITLKKNTTQNPCFMNAVDKSYASYEIAAKAWNKKLAEQDEKRIEDMDMALSFSLSFSSLNIQKANMCYK